MLSYYVITIAVMSTLIGFSSYIIYSESGIVPLLLSLGTSYLLTLFAFLIDAIVAILVRKFAKGKLIDPFSRFYHVGKREKRLQKLIGIRKWKDKIPEMGGLLAGFQKKKVESTSDPIYIMRFLVETCYAELMHFLSIPCGFLIIFLLPGRAARASAIAVAMVNAILELLPALVQRYTRPRLESLLRHAERSKNRPENAPESVENVTNSKKRENM